MLQRGQTRITATPPTRHFTPLSLWRGAGGEAGRDGCEAGRGLEMRLNKTGATPNRPPHLISYASKCSWRDAVSASVASHLAGITFAHGLLLLQPFVAIACRAAQLFLDTDKLVVLSHTVGTAQRTSLNLSRVGSNGDVGNGRIFRFTRTV